MSATPPIAFPWIAIPSFAQPGQLHAFVDRDDELRRLYTGIVSAGNAVRAGKRTGVNRRFAVIGPKGVGKSALVLQALGMIRDTVVAGQRLPPAPDMPEPIDWERWLILWLSGKNVASLEGIADAIRQDMLAVVDDAREAALADADRVLQLPLLDRIFRTREAKDYAGVRSAMKTLAETIRYVRLFQGSTETTTLDRLTQTESSQEAAASLEAQLKAQGAEVVGAEAKAGLKAAATYLRKTGSTLKMSVEAKRVVEAEWAVWALNDFFAATSAAGLPTVVALDDFDEFASMAGPSHAARAKVLHSVLGAFLGLKPTCFILAMRSEYMVEDVGRVQEVIHVPPMTRRSGLNAVSAWGHVFDLPNEAGTAFVALGERFLKTFDDDARVVNPWRFLQLTQSVAGQAPSWRDSKTEAFLIKDFLRRQGPYEQLGRIADAIAEAMPEAHILPCAAQEELESEPYEFAERDRLTLEQYGLIRPAMAGNPDDPRIVFDPLFAYLRAAGPRQVRVEPVAAVASRPRPPAPAPALPNGPPSSRS